MACSTTENGEGSTPRGVSTRCKGDLASALEDEAGFRPHPGDAIPKGYGIGTVRSLHPRPLPSAAVAATIDTRLGVDSPGRAAGRTTGWHLQRPQDCGTNEEDAVMAPSSNTSTVSFRTPYSRRIPDPNFHDRGIERHVWFVRVGDVPRGLPTDANARETNIRKQVYRTVEASLLNQEGEPGTFHLKHKGITLVADRVEKVADDEYSVIMYEGQGILDGGHTYTLLTKERDEELPKDQFVKFEVLTGVESDWIPELSAGLNTSVQVQPMSIGNLEGLFDWIKDELGGRPYFSELAWKENEGGSFDARDLVGLMTLFNIHHFSNTGDAHPIEGYKFKASALKRFEKDEKDGIRSYRRLRPVLHEILVLHDTIRSQARHLYNSATAGKGGGLKFVEHRERGEYAFPFTDTTDPYRLMNGALYPMLAAFRWMIEEDPESPNYRWRGGFNNVLKLFKEVAPELMKMTRQTSVELAYNVNAVGKSKSHWAGLHSKVAMADLMHRVPPAG